MTLVVSFEGWCLIRLATDPDPSDEPRGVSGYTFAFPGEPDLDRIVRFQPADRPDLVRSGWPEKWKPGVYVTRAVRLNAESAEVEALAGASVHLDGEPKLENRNWTLTLPGFEPIVPFNLRITKDRLVVSRYAPLDPDHPELPVWEATSDQLSAQGATGMSYEPDTIGQATGIWQSAAVIHDRLAALQAELAEAGGKRRAALEARIAELEYAVANPNDRRVAARSYVERFAFAMKGPPGNVADPAGALGELDTASPWEISFWIGAWDPDLLCAFVRGSLAVPSPGHQVGQA